ncbi:MAG: hypothetical protein AAFX06_19590 [Planctomycetota bacterium]
MHVDLSGVALPDGAIIETSSDIERLISGSSGNLKTLKEKVGLAADDALRERALCKAGSIAEDISKANSIDPILDFLGQAAGFKVNPGRKPTFGQIPLAILNKPAFHGPSSSTKSRIAVDMDHQFAIELLRSLMRRVAKSCSQIAPGEISYDEYVLLHYTMRSNRRLVQLRLSEPAISEEPIVRSIENDAQAFLRTSPVKPIQLHQLLELKHRWEQAWVLSHFACAERALRWTFPRQETP